MVFLQRHKCKGALVLVAVLWIIVLMMIITAVVGQASRIDTRISLVSAEQIRCKWACRAGVETAISILAEDERESDSLEELWSYNPEDFNDVMLDSVSFSVKVIDEAGKLNINTATKEQLINLPDMTEEAAESILDWRDGDDEMRQAGAEAGYYLNLPYGYEPRNGDFKTIRELLLVRGVTEALFYGDSSDEYVSDYNEGWINYLTCYSYDNNTDAEGNDRININSAQEAELVEKLGIKQSQARWIVENRQFDSIADLMGQQSQGGGSNQGNQGSQNNQNNQSSQQPAGPQTGPGQPRSGNNNQQQVQAEPLDLETFYRIVDKVTVTDDEQIPGRVNVNTAPFFVLAALLEGDEGIAEDIISYRNGLSEGIVSIGELKDVGSVTIDVARKFIDSVTTRSDVFTVQSTAQAAATGAERKLEVVVNRTESPPEMIYYRTGVDD
jgi:type II secretory pathway component PulK